jgi:hypothetical protein
VDLRFKTAAAAVLAVLAGALAGAGLPATGASAAPAAATWRYEYYVYDSTYTVVDFYYNETYAGSGVWNRDPNSYDMDGNGAQDPGDAIIAFDETADGWGIEASLNTGRVATTRGHDSPYSSGWKSGNLPEDTWYDMYVCLVKGTTEHCTSAILVSS